MLNNIAQTPKKSHGIKTFNYCPCCGQKGLYHVVRRYSRCRYCGLYRIALPGQDF